MVSWREETEASLKHQLTQARAQLLEWISCTKPKKPPQVESKRESAPGGDRQAATDVMQCGGLVAEDQGSQGSLPHQQETTAGAAEPGEFQEKEPSDCSQQLHAHRDVLRLRRELELSRQKLSEMRAELVAAKARIAQLELEALKGRDAAAAARPSGEETEQSQRAQALRGELGRAQEKMQQVALPASIMC